MYYERSEIETKVKEIIADQVGVSVSQIENDKFLHSELGLDSLDILSIINSIAIFLDITFVEGDLWQLERLQDLIEYLYSRQQSVV